MISKYNYFASLLTLLVFSRVTSFPAEGRNKCTVLPDLYPPSFNVPDVVKICEDDKIDSSILSYCKEIVIVRNEISSCKLGGLLNHGLKATNVIRKAVNVPGLNSNFICDAFTNLNSTLYHVYLDNPGFAKYLSGNMFCPLFCNRYNKHCEMLLRTYWIKNILLSTPQETKKEVLLLASDSKHPETKKKVQLLASDSKHPDIVPDKVIPLKLETVDPQSAKAVVTKNKIASTSSDFENLKHSSPSIIVSEKRLSNKTASKPISPSSSELNTKGKAPDDKEELVIDPLLLGTTIADTDGTSVLVGTQRPLALSNLDVQSKTIADIKTEKAGDDKDAETLPPKGAKTNPPKENKLIDDSKTEDEPKPENPDVTDKQTDKDLMSNTIDDKNNQPVTQMKDNKIEENSNNVDAQTSVILEKGDNMETTLEKDKYQDGPQDEAQTDTKENNIDSLLKADETTLEKQIDTVPQIPAFPEEEDSHFFAYFLTIVVFCIAGYLVFHNKQKIIALIVEGRHERRRRPNNGTYKRLDSKDGAKSASHVIF